MNFEEFTGEVQHRLEFPGTGETVPGTGETVRAIRATLMTLGQRIPEGAAEDLAASLPIEIKWHLIGAAKEHGQRFDWREYVSQFGEITGAERPDAAYQAHDIMDLVSTLVPSSDLRKPS